MSAEDNPPYVAALPVRPAFFPVSEATQYPAQLHAGSGAVLMPWKASESEKDLPAIRMMPDHRVLPDAGLSVRTMPDAPFFCVMVSVSVIVSKSKSSPSPAPIGFASVQGRFLPHRDYRGSQSRFPNWNGQRRGCS